MKEKYACRRSKRLTWKGEKQHYHSEEEGRDCHSHPKVKAENQN